MLKKPGSKLLAKLAEPSAEGGNNWASHWDHRYWQQPSWGPHSTMWTWFAGNCHLGIHPLRLSSIHQPVSTNPVTLQAKQQAGNRHSPTHQQNCCLKILSPQPLQDQPCSLEDLVPLHVHQPQDPQGPTTRDPGTELYTPMSWHQP